MKAATYILAVATLAGSLILAYQSHSDAVASQHQAQVWQHDFTVLASVSCDTK